MKISNIVTRLGDNFFRLISHREIRMKSSFICSYISPTLFLRSRSFAYPAELNFHLRSVSAFRALFDGVSRVEERKTEHRVLARSSSSPFVRVHDAKITNFSEAARCEVTIHGKSFNLRVLDIVSRLRVPDEVPREDRQLQILRRSNRLPEQIEWSC